MTKLTAKEKRVLGVLGLGKSQARNVSDLSKVTEMDTRTFNDIIFRLALKGIPIVSNRTGENRGVYIAETEEEKIEGLQFLKAQIKNMTKRVQAVQASNPLTWKDDFQEAI